MNKKVTNIDAKLPNGWEWKKIGDKFVCQLIMGQSPDSKSYNNSKHGLPFYQGKKDFGKEYPTPTTYCTKPIRIVESGDILLSVRAPVGTTNICKEQSCIGRGIAGIRANQNLVTNSFLLFYFKWYEKVIESKGKGSTFSAITKVDLEKLPIPLPPLAEQNKIVSVLESTFSKIDKSIALVKENIEKIKQLNASVMNYLAAEPTRYPVRTAEVAAHAISYIPSRHPETLHTFEL